MDDPTPSRLDHLSTSWDLLRQAHGSAADARQRAQEAILQRYTPAICRYLRGATCDSDVAADLFQEFALRFVRGDFRALTPERGRFRDYVGRVLQHLVTDHLRQRRLLHLDENAPIPAPELSSSGEDAFLIHWRDQLINQAFEALHTHERETHQPLYTVLRLRADLPEASSARLAEILSERLARPISPEWVRNRLHFARQLFGDLLVAETARSLPLPTEDEIADELAALGLLDLCRTALARRTRR